jgi:Radical SAM superfamily
MNKKIVLVSVPRLDPAPQANLRFLLKKLQDANIDSEIFDANLDLYKRYSDLPSWADIERWGIQQQDRQNTSNELWQELEKSFSLWAEQIINLHPTHVGICVFTGESRNWTQWLCYHIRKANPDIVIVLGGKGINKPGRPNADFGEYCLSWNLCDYYFNGESELELVNFLQDRPCIVNNPDTFVSFNDLDLSDFVYYSNDEYQLTSKWYDQPINVQDKLLKTYSTRGCVKKCTFCDVPLLRSNWSMRSPQNLFDEIRFAIEEHNVRSIAFTDEMINGSNKQFLAWLELLANYLEKNNIQDFQWESQFGLKSKQSIPTRTFDLLDRTGAALTIGIDHFSNAVLDHMEKRYKQDDIFWFFENANKPKITYKILMFIVGYPTETLADFEIFKNGIVELFQYQPQIQAWDFGQTCSIPFGSKLSKLENIELGAQQVDWYYHNNPTLTKEERLNRLSIIDQLSQEHQLNLTRAKATSLRVESWTQQ